MAPVVEKHKKSRILSELFRIIFVFMGYFGYGLNVEMLKHFLVFSGL